MRDPARQLIRAIRGPLSQVAFSRALGYSTNTAADWEAGRRFPTIEETLRAAQRRRIDVVAAFAAFHATAIPHFDPADLSGWLSQMRGSTTNREIAARSGFSEHAIGRWLRGVSRARLPQFLALVEAITFRCSDLVAALVPIERVPSLAEVHRARTQTRRLAYEHPWVAAILPQLGVLQRAGVRGDPADRIAQTVPLAPGEIRRIIDLLVDAGIVARDRRGVRVVRPLTVDARASQRDRSRLRAHWAEVSRRRLERPGPDDQFAYNVFNVSHRDLERIDALMAATYREIRAIIASSEAQTTAVLVTHLFPLALGPAPEE